jgi:hypothetical protein
MSYNKPTQRDNEQAIEFIELEEIKPSDADYSLADAMIEYYKGEL